MWVLCAISCTFVVGWWPSVELHSAIYRSLRYTGCIVMIWQEKRVGLSIWKISTRDALYVNISLDIDTNYDKNMWNYSKTTYIIQYNTRDKNVCKLYLQNSEMGIGSVWPTWISRRNHLSIRQPNVIYWIRVYYMDTATRNANYFFSHQSSRTHIQI